MEMQSQIKAVQFVMRLRLAEKLEFVLESHPVTIRLVSSPCTFHRQRTNTLSRCVV